MNRCLAFIAAVLLAFVTVSSACIAAPALWIHFTLEPAGRSDAIQASFRNERPNHENHWSTNFPASELVGLDLAGFRSSGSRPLSFAVIREAGRLDCTGNGGQSYAGGYCRFTADAAFARLLQTRGIGYPSEEQAFGLMAVNARRELIDTLATARYPMPTIDNLMALTALGVNGSYISEMTRARYRPASIDALIQFKALGITPQWISGFVRAGYGNLPADQLVQLKALNVTPEFIMAFERIGYHHLPVEDLVQLKALNITPEFVQRVAAVDSALPPVGKLVELKAFSRKH